MKKKGIDTVINNKDKARMQTTVQRGGEKSSFRSLTTASARDARLETGGNPRKVVHV